MTVAEPNQLKKPKVEEKLSEEDATLKALIDSKIDAILSSNDSSVLTSSLQALTVEVRGATASMTGVPKPLKFLKPHFQAMATRYDQLHSGPIKAGLADILAVLATISSIKEDSRLALKYYLEGSKSDLTSWGQEFMRSLSGEVADEHQFRLTNGQRTDDLQSIIDIIATYNAKHGAEVDAIDLLCEVDQIEKIVSLADAHSFERICMYLNSMASYASNRDEKSRLYKASLEIYTIQNQLPLALRLAMRLNSLDDITRLFSLAESDPATSRQLAHMLGRQGVRLQGLPEHLYPFINQESLTRHFKDLAKELDVLEAKTPEEIFKTHLEEKRTTVQLDSAKQNLAASFANAFVNLGFCSDKLLTVEGSGWLFKNKDLGMFSTAASLGMLMLWDLDDGMNQIDKFQWSTDVNVKAGALLAFGMTCTGVNNEVDPAWALLAEHLENTEQPLIRQAAILGLGFAYAGTRREELLENLTPLMIDADQPLETAALCAAALGLSYVGSGSEDASMLIQQCLVDKITQKTKLDGTSAAFLLPCALGLIWQSHSEAAPVDAFVNQLVSAGAEERFTTYCRVVLESFAYAGTGDVLRVQKLLQTCAEVIPETATAPEALGPESAALLGVAMVAVGEEIGSEMCLRTFDRIHQYGNIAVKRVIPLAIAFLNLSNPRPAVIDTLSKLSHESDAELAANAIFGMGLVGLGTNNSRLAGLFRQLAAYFTKDATMLFVIRLAQGLLYCGKGLVTCNPIHSDRFLASAPALGSLAVLFQAVLAMKANLFSTHHYLLFFLVPSITPRMLVTLDAETGEPLPVTVRVGQAVDVTGQAGKPKTVTGFQTHITPVLLGHSDRAELATEEYLPLTPVLEGLVLLRKNPDYKPAEDK